MREIFISIWEKGRHKKEYIFQFPPSLKILGNYKASKDVVEWSVIKERWMETAVKELIIALVYLLIFFNEDW